GPSQLFYDFIVRNLFSQAGVRAWKIDESEVSPSFIDLVQNNGCPLIVREASVVDHGEVIVSKAESSSLHINRFLRSADPKLDRQFAAGGVEFKHRQHEFSFYLVERQFFGFKLEAAWRGFELFVVYGSAEFLPRLLEQHHLPIGDFSRDLVEPHDERR